MGEFSLCKVVQVKVIQDYFLQNYFPQVQGHGNSMEFLTCLCEITQFLACLTMETMAIIRHRLSNRMPWVIFPVICIDARHLVLDRWADLSSLPSMIIRLIFLMRRTTQCAKICKIAAIYKKYMTWGIHDMARLFV